MIWIIVYFIIGIFLAVFYTKRLQKSEPDIDSDEVIAYFVVCILLWPFYVFIDTMT